MVATRPKPLESDIDDYLANLSVGFEEARRFLDLFKREPACDDGLQLPRSEPAGNECFCTFQGSVVVRDLSIQIALQGQALAQYCEQRKRRRLRAERAIFEQDAASGHAVCEGDEGRTTHWIEHNARTDAASDLHYSCDEILLIRHDNMICSVVNERDRKS